jgi:hypothetical protein
MSIDQLLNTSLNMDWNWKKNFEFNEEHQVYRYKTSFLWYPTMFHLLTKKEDRGKGYSRKLLKKVMQKEAVVETIISATDMLRMQKFLIENGMEYDSKFKSWVSSRRPKKYESDSELELRYSKPEFVPYKVGSWHYNYAKSMGYAVA